MKEIREVCSEYEKIAEDLLKKEKDLAYIANSSVKITYLKSNSLKKKGDNLVFGQCEKIPNKYKWGTDSNFAITVFAENCLHFSEDQLRILIFHELLHIGIEKDMFGAENYSVVNHDLEDFRIIIDKYGTDWDKKQ